MTRKGRIKPPGSPPIAPGAGNETHFEYAESFPARPAVGDLVMALAFRDKHV